MIRPTAATPNPHGPAGLPQTVGSPSTSGDHSAGDGNTRHRQGQRPSNDLQARCSVEHPDHDVQAGDDCPGRRSRDNRCRSRTMQVVRPRSAHQHGARHHRHGKHPPVPRGSTVVDHPDAVDSRSATCPHDARYQPTGERYRTEHDDRQPRHSHRGQTLDPAQVFLRSSDSGHGVASARGCRVAIYAVAGEVGRSVGGGRHTSHDRDRLRSRRAERAVMRRAGSSDATEGRPK